MRIDGFEEERGRVRRLEPHGFDHECEVAPEFERVGDCTPLCSRQQDDVAGWYERFPERSVATNSDGVAMSPSDDRMLAGSGRDVLSGRGSGVANACAHDTIGA